MNTQDKILRPTSRYWIQSIGEIAIILIILPIAGILYFGEKMVVAGGFALLIGIPYLISELRTISRQQITFTQSEIVARMGKEDLRQSWESIRAVRFKYKGQSRLLVLYCDEHILNLHSKFYDEAELTHHLKEHLSSSVLDPQAYQKTHWFLEWQESITKKLLAMKRPLKVSLGGFEKWLGVFSVSLGVLFVGLYFFSKAGLIDAVMGGGLFGGLGLLLLFLSIGWVEGDNSKISVRSLFRKNTFFWNDLREIYVNSNQDIIALVGENSRLIVPKATNWSGSDKELLHELIRYKIEMSKIEPIESRKPLFWFSKNP